MQNVFAMYVERTIPESDFDGVKVDTRVVHVIPELFIEPIAAMIANGIADHRDYVEAGKIHGADLIGGEVFLSVRSKP